MFLNRTDKPILVRDNAAAVPNPTSAVYISFTEGQDGSYNLMKHLDDDDYASMDNVSYIMRLLDKGTVNKSTTRDISDDDVTNCITLNGTVLNFNPTAEGSANLFFGNINDIGVRVEDNEDPRKTLDFSVTLLFRLTWQMI